MRNFILLLFTISLSNAFSQNATHMRIVPGNHSHQPDLVGAIPSPTTSPNDIAFDGHFLWVEGYNDFTLFQISRSGGTVVRTIPNTIQRPYGLEFALGHLWVADADNKLIQEVDTSNGNLISQFPTPSVYATSYPTGLAWDGTNLWSNDPMNTGINPDDSTYSITTTGQILQAFHGHGGYVTGLAFDGHYLWSTDNQTMEIYKIDLPSFTIIDSIATPGGMYPNGLAFDGKYLWLVNNDSDSLYQINIDETATVVREYNTDVSNVRIYPNPARNFLTIEIPQANKQLSYQIFDMTGREVMRGQIISPVSIIEFEFKPGEYILNIDNTNRNKFTIIE